MSPLFAVGGDIVKEIQICPIFLALLSKIAKIQAWIKIK